MSGGGPAADSEAEGAHASDPAAVVGRVAPGFLAAVPGRFLALLAVSTLGTLSTGMVAPVLPLFVAGELGAGETLVGLTVSTAAACSLISGLLAGPQADRRGRRIVALTGLSMAAAGALLLIPLASVPGTLLTRALYGLGAGMAMTATIAWAVDQVPAEWRGRALSVFGMTVWIGLSAGPQLGQAVLDAAGYPAVWAAIAALELSALALVGMLRERRPAPRPVHEPSTATVVEHARRLVPGGALRPGLLIALAAYGEGVITAFLVLHLVERGVPGDAGFGGAASVFTVFALSVLGFRLVGGHLIDRRRPELVAVGGFLADALGLTLLAVSSSFTAAAAGAAVMGAGFAVLFPSLALVATRASGEERRGAALGAYTSLFSLGLALGSLIGGPIAALTGTAGAHLSAALAAAGGAAWLVRSTTARGRPR